jgi:hypothetical protein
VPYEYPDPFQSSGERIPVKAETIVLFEKRLAELVTALNDADKGYVAIPNIGEVGGYCLPDEELKFFGSSKRLGFDFVRSEFDIETKKAGSEDGLVSITSYLVLVDGTFGKLMKEMPARALSPEETGALATKDLEEMERARSEGSFQITQPEAETVIAMVERAIRLASWRPDNN